MARRRSTSGVQRKGRPLIRLKTFDAMDGRTHAVLRARAIMSDLESDLGGADNITAAEKQIVQHASVLAAILEHRECQWLAGEEINVNEHLAGVNCQLSNREGRDTVVQPDTVKAARCTEIGTRSRGRYRYRHCQQWDCRE